MACKFCIEEKIIIEKRIISPTSWGWGYSDTKINLEEAEDGADNFGFFIDKRCDSAYLRFADLNDCDCIDHGDKVEIKFCPFCGEELPKMKEWDEDAI